MALLLPREVLAMPVPEAAPVADPPAVAPTAPDPAALAIIAHALAQAARPMIVTASAGRDIAVPALLADLAARHAIRVVE